MDKMQALADSVATSTYVNMACTVVCLLACGFLIWITREIKASNDKLLEEVTALLYTRGIKVTQDNTPNTGNRG